ncbi:hypothetical protein POM88_024432 [Heracleum sosnowskyi]|uniref:Aminotransferase-like plant mobile domain-containing protein n=1 Tax=Heracleum sosnowskyi TaxID=360622 RepID=A0AAD8MMV2_9APIA|nr:hypothetical protein POM88_024432 [Heracleum sosnowskyi]
MDPNNEMSMNPGPRDSYVLHLQSQHRSDVVWKAGGGDCQRSRKRDPTQNKFFKSIEGPVGECSITLHDVNVLLALRIDGDAVTGGDKIHCMYLPLIQDFGRCRTLAWGSAVLAFLYRELCKACKIGVRENVGCLILLQLWAWTRLSTLAPVPRGPSLENSVIWGDRPGPYGMRGVIDGDMSYIDSIVSNGRQLLQDQFTREFFQDFPIEDRREKETEMNKKSKKTGGNNVGDDGDIHLGDEGGFAGETSTHEHENEAETVAQHFATGASTTSAGSTTAVTTTAARASATATDNASSTA